MNRNIFFNLKVHCNITILEQKPSLHHSPTAFIFDNWSIVESGIKHHEFLTFLAQTFILILHYIKVIYAGLATLDSI